MRWPHVYLVWWRGVGVLALTLLVSGWSGAAARLVAQQPAALAFRGVTVIDVTDGRRLLDQTVVVIGSRIQTVGPVAGVAVPAGAQVVDAKGKYLLPGFWDMHAHVDGRAESLYPLFVAHGITGIRELGQRWAPEGNDGGGSPEAADSFRAWQRQVMAGTRIGPRSVGPSADVSYMRALGPGIYGPEYAATHPVTPDVARRVIDSLKAAGDAFVRTHGDPDDRESFFAMLRESRRVGLPVVGHVPGRRVSTNVEAADSGMRSFEHLDVAIRDCWDYVVPPPNSAALEAACAPDARAYVRNGSWVTPTLVAYWKMDNKLKYTGEQIWPTMLALLRTLHDLGVKNWLAGADAGDLVLVWNPAMRPGLSLRDELVFLADGGLTPLEALQAATLNPARFFAATDSLGTVAAGKLADLVLLDADPLADIMNVLKLWGVVANGRYFDHTALVELDPEGFEPGAGVAAADRRRSAAADTTRAPIQPQP